VNFRGVGWEGSGYNLQVAWGERAGLSWTRLGPDGRAAPPGTLDEAGQYSSIARSRQELFFAVI